MRTKTPIRNVSAHQPSDAPEIALLAILASMVLLRMLDVFSPPALENSSCAPRLANRAIIACAVRGDQARQALPQTVAGLTGRR